VSKMLAGLIAVLLVLAVSTPALAHGAGEEEFSKSAAVNLRLAYALLQVHMDDEAMERIEAAASAPEQDGIDLAEVEAARQALDSGQTQQALDDIRAALAAAGLLAPDNGQTAQPGQVFLDKLAVKYTGRPWELSALVVAVLMVAGGLGILYRTRVTAEAGLKGGVTVGR